MKTKIGYRFLISPISTICLCVLCFFSELSLGQTINDSLIVSCYNKTIISYFSDTTNLKGQKQYNNIHIFTNTDYQNLIDQIDSYHLKYHPKKTDIRDILEKPLRKNNGRYIYGLNHIIKSQDTIEVNLTGETIVEISKKSINIGLWCGGTLGYIPTAKFIFNYSQNSWDYYNYNTLVRDKLKEFEQSNYR